MQVEKGKIYLQRGQELNNITPPPFSKAGACVHPELQQLWVCKKGTTSVQTGRVCGHPGCTRRRRLQRGREAVLCSSLFRSLHLLQGSSLRCGVQVFPNLLFIRTASAKQPASTLQLKTIVEQGLDICELIMILCLFK